MIFDKTVKLTCLFIIQILIGILALLLASHLTVRGWILTIGGILVVLLLNQITIGEGIIKKEPLSSLFHVLFLLGVSFVCLFLSDYLNLFSFSFTLGRGHKEVVLRTCSNMIIFMIALLCLYAVTARAHVAVIVVTSLVYVWSLGSYYVYTFRGVPIVPWDIYAAKTAMNVAANYDFIVYPRTIYAWIIVCIFQQLAVILLHESGESQVAKSIKKQIVALAAMIALVFIYRIAFWPRIYIDLCDVQWAYKLEGQIPGFIRNISYGKYDKPAGYGDATEVEQKLNQYELENASRVMAKNIIVVMNESFADLSCLGTPMKAEYIPYYNSLSENTSKGEIVPPVFGGGTCNTEFEALTGDSTSYNMPVPYATILNQDAYSILRVLKDNDFYCDAYHPGKKGNWNRKTAYTYLGFDRFDALEDSYTDAADWIGSYLSDRYDVDEVIRRFEERDKDRPYFLFNVSIQNHGGYGQERENLTITPEASLYDYTDVQSYLSLIQESDVQLERLISYFETVDEPTLICFFGDHLPALNEDFLNAQEGDNADPYRRYETPFFLWTNYDSEAEDLGIFSANYIGPILLQHAGISLSGYEAYLMDLHDKYPIISTWGITDSEGNYYRSRGEIEDPELAEYENMIYYNLREWK